MIYVNVGYSRNVRYKGRKKHESQCKQNIPVNKDWGERGIVEELMTHTPPGDGWMVSGYCLVTSRNLTRKAGDRMVSVNGMDAVKFEVMYGMMLPSKSFDNEYDASGYVIKNGDMRYEILAVNKNGDARKVKLSIPKLHTLEFGSVKVVNTKKPHTQWAEFSDDSNRVNLESAVISYIVCFRILNYDIMPKHPYSSPLQLMLD